MTFDITKGQGQPHPTAGGDGRDDAPRNLGPVGPTRPHLGSGG